MQVMSRLRRLVVSYRFFLIICRLLPHRGRLAEAEFECLARVETVDYVHLNPVRAGLVERAEEWPWSSVRDYAETPGGAGSAHGLLPINRILLPADEWTRI